MPQIFKIGSYLIYFWSNENRPLEPIHVHISKGYPYENSTKVWSTRSGKCILQNNNSKIPTRQLNIIIKTIESRSSEIINKWYSYFNEIRYFC